MTINYHPDKANVVADALSRKNSCNLAYLITSQRKTLEDLDRTGIKIRVHQIRVKLANMVIQHSLLDEIKANQQNDAQLLKIKRDMEEGTRREFNIHKDGSLRFGTRVCVPNIPEIKKKILKEAHHSLYTMHPGSTKMYKDLKQIYWWNNMKKEIAIYVTECFTCQQVKAEHQRPAGLVHNLDIPM
ncbi:uncharacterized protein LOC109821640 [Asparagus officinalis]|uniref:uncharacterized protein LOC109821640 n=1 Tax=Asparagus officinalis TaxID=4686 RepID=UPI00098E2A78|nr:uncharacterized protein LOC109821640 [Asparagus officinalis]